MTDLNKEREVNLRFEQDDGFVWVFDGDSQFGTEISHLMMMHADEYNEDELRVICNHAACEIGRLRAELEKAKAQAVPASHTHSVTLTCTELKEAYDFGAPDESHEQLTDLVTIGWQENGHSGSGYYAYMTECEDEGSIKLGESESGASQ
ncbi:hypothetical protein C7G80_01330 [Acinetobacter nosocomialis]|uniref:hypothetical protein n=1 Tax=Acinetobacter nosocomialis TaxID=106654 RepID=UPI000D0F843D|nr:hypothetical protein [Acinetobacter nosocomialis]PSD73544.1 hypothetical protein C7G80_01330 [Acinetobacter nosocomialis]